MKDLIALVADRLKSEKPLYRLSMGGMIHQQPAPEHPSRVKALGLVSTTDGAVILDQDLASIGKPHTNAEVSTKILQERYPPGRTHSSIRRR